MSWFRAKTLGLALSLFLLCAVSAAAQVRRVRPHRVARQNVAAVPVAPAPAPAVLLPVQMPATPPQVSYQNGLLTIVAPNSTLGDILNAVRSHTGAAVDIPPADTSERVIGQLGPGPARDVLTQLLNGSSFNYVMTSPGNDPGALAHLVLIPRVGIASSAASSASSAVYNSQPQQPVVNNFGAPPVIQQPLTAEEPEAPVEDEAADVTDEQEVQPTPEETGAEQPQNPGPQGARTPEQLLQDLQQQQQRLQLLQQQQQQFQQQQPPNQQGPNPSPQVE